MGLGRGALLLPIYLVILGLGYVVNHKRLQFSKRFFSILLFWCPFFPSGMPV